MSELLITFDKESPSLIDEKIKIKAIAEERESLEYKFLEGKPGERNLIWKPIQDFSTKNECEWKPIKPGEYMIMVQSKDKKSNILKNAKAIYKIKTSKEELSNIKENKEKLIKSIITEKDSLILGEKINIEVMSKEDEELLYRFLIKGNHDWEIIKDYSTENKLTYTTIENGNIEILIECKRLASGRKCRRLRKANF